jgi:hypothetical protein
VRSNGLRDRRPEIRRNGQLVTVIPDEIHRPDVVPAPDSLLLYFSSTYGSDHTDVMNESTTDEYIELRIAETIHHVWERVKSITKDLEDCKRMIRPMRGEAYTRGCNGHK